MAHDDRERGAAHAVARGQAASADVECPRRRERGEHGPAAPDGGAAVLGRGKTPAGRQPQAQPEGGRGCARTAAGPPRARRAGRREDPVGAARDVAVQHPVPQPDAVARAATEPEREPATDERRARRIAGSRSSARARAGAKSRPLRRSVRSIGRPSASSGSDEMASRDDPSAATTRARWAPGYSATRAPAASASGLPPSGRAARTVRSSVAAVAPADVAPTAVTAISAAAPRRAARAIRPAPSVPAGPPWPSAPSSEARTGRTGNRTAVQRSDEPDFLRWSRKGVVLPKAGVPLRVPSDRGEGILRMLSTLGGARAVRRVHQPARAARAGSATRARAESPCHRSRSSCSACSSRPGR